MEILTNHIGYAATGRKYAIIACTEGQTLLPSDSCRLERSGELVHQAEPGKRLYVEGWKNRYYYIYDFSDVVETGHYRIIVETGGREIQSSVFSISDQSPAESVISDILFYYKSQRCSWRWNEADSHAAFFGKREGAVDVSGGWFDASGDYSKYLSHLSYANYMNPQQTPLVVWALLELHDYLDSADNYRGTLIVDRALEEGLFGADFLVRMQDDAGYFYMTVFDQWSKDVKRRMIASFSEMKGTMHDSYQAGFRQGGGMAIAALAKAARYSISGEFSSADYLDAAVRGFDHLEEHNPEYLDNGRENIIDHYCALMAAVELYKSTGQAVYLGAARSRAAHLGLLYNTEAGYWLVEETSERPYFHAAEAGLPIIALIEYSKIESDAAAAKSAEELIHKAVSDLLDISGRRNENPFLLARQWVKASGDSLRKSFFIPHENESGYWWQGENARLASLSAAARRSKHLLDSDKARAADEFADAQLHWILGLNPYDICMLQGHGRNNPSYEKHYPNAPGGICNGITGGLNDEDDIDFLPKSVAHLGEYRWRWSEQWIPHAAWFILAAVNGNPVI